MNRLILAAALAVSPLATVSASPPRHAPFEKGAEPAPFALARLLVEEDEHAVVFADPTGRVSDRLVLLKDDRQVEGTIEVVSADGSLRWRSEPFTIGPNGANASLADFDADGTPDYVVGMPTGGCGIHASSLWLHFIHARPDGSYEMTSTTSMFVRNQDYVDVNGDGHMEFIRTSLVDGSTETCRDGKRHNYWVHQLLTFENGRLVDGAHLDRRFPMWIWYTYRENHQPTTMITAEQKRRLWERSHARQEFPPARR